MSKPSYSYNTRSKSKAHNHNITIVNDDEDAKMKDVTTVKSRVHTTTQAMHNNPTANQPKQHTMNQQQSNNSYKCQNCQRCYNLNDPMMHSGEIKHYISTYICANCEKDAATQSIKISTSYKCTELMCKDCTNVKIWTGRDARKNWSNHYRSYHPTKRYLDITQQKLCDDSICSVVMPRTMDKCINHNGMKNDIVMTNEKKPALKRQRSVTLNEYEIIDGNAEIFDIREALYQVDVNEDIKNEESRDKAAKVMVAALNKISQHHSNTRLAIEGAIELRLYAATYHHMPYRDRDQNQIKQGRLLETINAKDEIRTRPKEWKEG